MIKITNSVLTNPSDILNQHSLGPGKTLFLDIETTGLSPKRNRVCLIGCAFLSADTGTWQIVQWFDDTGSSERELLLSFADVTENYDNVIHFNGRAFDLPFLEKRAFANSVPLSFKSKKSVDLYRILTARKSVLGLSDYRQQTAEAAMGTGRSESTSGGDFVRGYFQYLRTGSEETRRQILLHNYADMEGLLSLAPVLVFDDLSLLDLTVTRATIDTADTADGTVQDQLCLACRLSQALPLPIHAHRGGCFLKAERDRCLIVIPLLYGEMKLFFPDYRNYYYLPAEDRAIHRSVGSFVDRGRRVPAKAQTCYERVQGTFLPVFGNISDVPLFQKNYRDRDKYILFDDKMKCDQTALSRYARHIFCSI